MVAPTCFVITLPSSGSVPSAFWEMLNWAAVDKSIVDGRVVSSGVVRTHNATRHIMLPEDGNVMPKHVGATIHN
jgi:hypothetical protein